MVCPAGSTRGHGPGITSPADPRIQQRSNVVKSVPPLHGRHWQLGQQLEVQGDLFIFSLALLAIFCHNSGRGRTRNSIFRVRGTHAPIMIPEPRISLRHPTSIQKNRAPTTTIIKTSQQYQQSSFSIRQLFTTLATEHLHRRTRTMTTPAASSWVYTSRPDNLFL